MTDTSATGRPSLAVELHNATRSEHATLNRTIITRLPLCLPQASSTPALFAQGMTAISQIYFGFEEAWDLLLSTRSLEHRQKAFLTQLNIASLSRTDRLNRSLQELKKLSSQPSEVQLTRIRELTSCFREEIKSSILDRPHLIMACSWTMYLALFNGGRWIAKQLLNAGTLFWGSEDRAAIVDGALSFWFFGHDEDYDGEDLKIAFKHNFELAAENLTTEEREEVISEGKKVFRIFTEIIEILDRNAHAGESAEHAEAATRRRSSTSMPADDTGMLGYLPSIIPASVTSLWRSLVSRLPASQTSLPKSLRSKIEQKHE